MPIRVAVLTVSDACAAGAREDRSGEELVAWVNEGGHHLAARATVPDSSVDIVRALLSWCDSGAVDLILTTGGTGLSPRDNTPEATVAVLDRQAPGLMERLRGHNSEQFPRASLGRGVAGMRGRTIVINLPGSPSGVRDGVRALAPVIEHAVSIARGEPTDHSAGIV